MQLFVVFAAFAVCHGEVVRSFYDEAGVHLDHHVDSLRTCVGSSCFRVDYSVVSVATDALIDLDETPTVASVTCDIDGTSLLTHFSNSADAVNFIGRVNPFETFVVGGAQWGCVDRDGAATVITRRINSFTLDDTNTTVALATSVARYDEIMKEGNISFSSSNASLNEPSKTVCLGYNVDASCKDAKQPIPLYSNSHLSVQCSDCFLGLEATLFVDIELHGWKLRSLAGGLRGIAINAAVIADMTATGSWSTGVQKTLNVVTNKPIISFKIGLIPLQISYSIPVNVDAQFEFDATAHAQVGLTGVWSIGDAYVSWDPDNRWQFVTPQPSLSWSPVASGDAQFTGKSTIAISPSFELLVNKFFTTTTTFTPTVIVGAKGDTTSKQICTSGDYSLDLAIAAELDIDIPWLHINQDKHFGPKDIVNTGVKHIGDWCIKV